MSTFRRSSRQMPVGRRRRHASRVVGRRYIGCEQLEARQLLAADLGQWQNPFIPTDVNDDGVTTTMDALTVANAINAFGQGELRTLLASSVRGEGTFSAYYDVNGDDYLTSNDFLRIANAVNEGEGNDTMTYTLRTFNEAGTQEISTVGVGQKFVLRAFVRDNRSLGNFPNGNPREGVFAAYLDVKYPAALADVSGPLAHNNTDYGQAPSGNTATDGIIDGAGSFRGSLTPTGRSEFLLWSLPMTASAQGTITFTGEPTTDPADPGDQGQSPSLDTGVYGEDRPICPSVATCTGTMGFMNTSLAVVTDIAAVNDAFTVAEDSGPTSPNPSVIANDQVLNPPGGTPTITAVTQGNNGATVTFTPSNVSYRPAPNFSGTDTFTYTISNGQGATAVGTVTVTVTGANDPPVVTVPGAQTIVEDIAGGLVFNTANNRRISLADGDGDVNVQATFSAANGRLSLPSAAGLTITGNNTTSLQVTGAISAINTALAGTGLTYQPNANFNGSDTLTVVANDQGNTGGGPLTDTKTVGITITAVNDAPVNVVPGDSTTEEDEALTFSTATGNALGVSDVDSGSSPLLVRLSVNQGGTINLASTAGVTVSNNGTASVDITGPATAINSALGAGVTFTPASGFVGDLIFTMRSDDQGATGSGGAQVDTDTFLIDVDTGVRPRALNDTATVAEDSTAGVTINVLQNDRAHDNATKLLKSFTQPAIGGVVTRIDNGTATTSDDQLRFVPNADFFGTATFTYTMNDSNETLPAGDPNRGVDSTATVVVTVTGINDAPINTVPGAQTTAEDTAKVINGISVADNDAGTSNIEVTLSVTNGKVNVNAAGLTVTGNGTGSAKLTGPLAAINTALSGVTYTPNQDFSGSDTLTVATSDLGNTGTPGALTDTDTVAITITAVNDAPVNTVPAQQTANKNENFVLSTAAGNAIQIADVDAGNSNVQVVLAMPNGTLNVSSATGVTITGNNSGNVTLTGPVSAINSALGAGVTYSPTTDFTGNAILTVTTNDQGNTGSGGAQSDTDTVTIKVEDFRPSTIGGGVYVDSNGNGTRDSAELGLSGVRITLTGTDINGQAVNLETRTDSSGRFSFANLKPGTYTLEQIQPVGFRDGADSFGTSLSAAGNDRATITIVRPGGINSTNTLFGELGLEARFMRAGHDLLASSARPDLSSGVVFGFDGNSAWSVFRGEGWEAFDNPRVTVQSVTADGKYAVVTLTARHKASGADRSVTLNSQTDSRLIYIEGDNATVIRFNGRPEDLFAMAGGEGEGMSGADYSQAVDAVMAETSIA